MAMCVIAARVAGADELAVVKDRFIQSILPTGHGERASITSEAGRYAASIMVDGRWGDIDYADQTLSLWLAREHLQRLLVMAKGCRLSADAELKAKTQAALSFWLDHDFHNPNWWWNEIGVPQLLGETALMIQNDLSDAQCQAVGKIMARGVWTKWTGQNLIWGVTNQILRGCLVGSENLVAEAYKRFYDEIRVVPADQEGIQADYSFHQHGAQFYSGGYGLAFAQDTARFTSFVWGTKYQIPAENLDVLEHYLLDGEAWMVCGDTFDYSAMGREITRKGKAAVSHSWTSGPIAPAGAAYTLGNAVRLLTSHELPRKAEFDAFAARLRGDGTSPLVGNKHFWKSDYMSHRRAEYFASVRMFSDRLINTEQVNSEGRKSQHLADGCCLLYRNGYEYTNIFPLWDWAKVPGTTAEQGALDIEAKSIGTRGKTSFVGGASDGTYGIAAMDLQRGQLKAHKAWMFFDDEFVCMGAGITCTSENPVATSVNQCWLHGAIAKGTVGAASWFQHDGVGYVFLSDERVHLTSGAQKGSWADIGTGSAEVLSERVFNLWIDHGARASDGTYAYIVLPGALASTTEARVREPDIEIVSNSPEMQAVRHRISGRIMAAFYAPGKLSLGGGHELSVDQPCLLILDSSQVTVSNPRNQAMKVHVGIGDKGIDVSLPGGELAGSSVTTQLP